MAKKKQQYIVHCRIIGYADVFVEASSGEEAIELVEDRKYDESEIDEWEISQVLRSDLNEQPRK